MTPYGSFGGRPRGRTSMMPLRPSGFLPPRPGLPGLPALPDSSPFMPSAMLANTASAPNLGLLEGATPELPAPEVSGFGDVLGSVLTSALGQNGRDMVAVASESTARDMGQRHALQSLESQRTGDAGQDSSLSETTTGSDGEGFIDDLLDFGGDVAEGTGELLSGAVALPMNLADKVLYPLQLAMGHGGAHARFNRELQVAKTDSDLARIPETSLATLRMKLEMENQPQEKIDQAMRLAEAQGYGRRFGGDRPRDGGNLIRQARMREGWSSLFATPGERLQAELLERHDRLAPEMDRYSRDSLLEQNYRETLDRGIANRKGRAEADKLEEEVAGLKMTNLLGEVRTSPEALAAEGEKILADAETARANADRARFLGSPEYLELERAAKKAEIKAKKFSAFASRMSGELSVARLPGAQADSERKVQDLLLADPTTGMSPKDTLAQGSKDAREQRLVIEAFRKAREADDFPTMAILFARYKHMLPEGTTITDDDNWWPGAGKPALVLPEGMEEMASQGLLSLPPAASVRDTPDEHAAKREQAAAIIDNPELSDAEKVKQIEAMGLKIKTK